MSSDAVRLFRMLRDGFKLKICNLFAVTQNRQMNEPAPMENRLKTLQKIVLRLEMKGDKCKKIALQSGAKIEGIESLSINMEDRTLTVIGEADPGFVEKTLRRKFRCVEIVSVEPMSSLPQEEKPPTAALPPEKKPDTEWPWPRRRWPRRLWPRRRRPSPAAAVDSNVNAAADNFAAAVDPNAATAATASTAWRPQPEPEHEGGKDDGSASSEEKTIVKVEKDGPK